MQRRVKISVTSRLRKALIRALSPRYRGIKTGLFVYIDNNSVVGKYCFFGDYTQVTKASIGNYCSVGVSVIIGPGSHDYTMFSTSSAAIESQNYSNLTKQDCIIGHDVWIGSQSVILRGVEVGNGCIIAAGSVVTKDVPPYSIVAGVPAKIIKMRFDKKQIEQIQNSKWWELPQEAIQNSKLEEILKNEI